MDYPEHDERCLKDAEAESGVADDNNEEPCETNTRANEEEQILVQTSSSVSSNLDEPNSGDTSLVGNLKEPTDEENSLMKMMEASCTGDPCDPINEIKSTIDPPIFDKPDEPNNDHKSLVDMISALSTGKHDGPDDKNISGSTAIDLHISANVDEPLVAPRDENNGVLPITDTQISATLDEPNDESLVKMIDALSTGSSNEPNDENTSAFQLIDPQVSASPDQLSDESNSMVEIIHIINTGNPDEPSDKDMVIETNEIMKEIVVESTDNELESNIEPPMDALHNNHSKEKSPIKCDTPGPMKASLEIIYHPPVYELPIAINPKYDHLDFTQRAELILNFHKIIDKATAKIARNSLVKAPLPKPILASHNCTDSLLKTEAQIREAENQQPVEESPDIYVSRAGRHVKRKVYTEEVSLFESDTEAYYLSRKKYKPEYNSDLRLTIDNPYVPENSNKPGTSADSENYSEEYKVGDSNDNFLEAASGQIDRRRAPPRILARRAIRNSTQEDQSSSSTSDLRDYRVVQTRNKKPCTQTRASSPPSDDPEPSRMCPICSENYPQSKIEAHAATCGIDENGEFIAPAVATPGGVLCPHCSRMLPSEQDYFIHLSRCIATRVADL